MLMKIYKIKTLVVVFSALTLFTTGCQPSIENSNKIIADSVKAYIIRMYLINDRPKIKIDTLAILKTNLISRKEIIKELIKNSEDEYSSDKSDVERVYSMISMYERSIKMYSGFLENNYNTTDENIDYKKSIKEDSIRMMEYYSRLDTPKNSLSKITKYRDSLSLILAYVDTIKKDNYLSLVHFSVSQTGGKYEDNIWFYLDKKYNIVCYKEFKGDD